MPQSDMAPLLVSALGLGLREHVAIVGGGGKTSLCFALAEELQRAGRRVITTTTTKVWQTEAERAPGVVFSPFGSPPFTRLKEDLREKGHVFLAQRPLDSGKVEGISRETADAFFHDLKPDYLIVEADGAAGRPVKAPAPHEPVIPSSATLVIAMAGLEAIGMPVNQEVVFRSQLFEEITGLAEGEPITMTALAKVFQSPQGPFKGSPHAARRIVFLNKSDRLRRGLDAVELIRRLVQNPQAPIERVIIGSLLKGIYQTHIRAG